jgi:glyoxylase-like metal-dependent hydrolase (beta-lactamase superfamily II)
MQSWQIGDVTVTRIVEFETRIPWREQSPFIAEATPAALAGIPWLAPHYVTPEGHLRSSVHALLVDAPNLRLVVDTCIGNDKPRRLTGGHALQTRFLEGFEAAGWKRERVDVVVCTHLHVDHVGWNTMLADGKWVPTFPRARYLFARAEFEYWQQYPEAEQQALMNDSIRPIFDAGLADLVATDHVLSPEIRLIPTPGHTPGHVSVEIRSAGARALITGDFIHHPCQIARPEWCVPFDEDRDAALEMRRQMLEALADQPTLMIGTHFATPAAGCVRRDEATYRFDV